MYTFIFNVYIYEADANINVQISADNFAEAARKLEKQVKNFIEAVNGSADTEFEFYCIKNDIFDVFKNKILEYGFEIINPEDIGILVDNNNEQLIACLIDTKEEEYDDIAFLNFEEMKKVGLTIDDIKKELEGIIYFFYHLDENGKIVPEED